MTNLVISVVLIHLIYGTNEATTVQSSSAPVGTTTTDPPTTTDIPDCGYPTPPFGSAYLLYNDTTFGSTANISCEPGYNISGASFITCQANGTWSSDTTCEPIDCGPPAPMFGKSNTTATTYGSLAEIGCDEGYIVSGDTLILCQSNGTWSSNTTCIPIDCGNYSISFGTFHLYNNPGTTFGSTGFFECDLGYNMSGDQFTMCQSNGTWSSYATCELADCLSPAPLNGFYSGNTTLGQTAVISCQPGYMLSGDSNMTCTPSGWNGFANCTIIDCDNLTIPFGNVYFYGGLTYGSHAYIYCDTGYIIDGESYAYTTCQSNGTWSSNATCELADCLSPAPLNGFYSGNTTLGQTAVISCQLGYRLSGDSNVTCTPTGWNGFANCTIIDCGNVTVPFGRADFYTGGSTYGSYAYIFCDTGYIINGDSFTTCQLNGTWSSNATCEPIDCGDPTPTFGTSNHIATTFNSSAAITCYPGYNLSGDSIVTCELSGTWSRNTTCEPSDCGQVPTISDGYVQAVDPANTTYGALANVTCNPGFIPNIPEITCTENGTWQKPVCLARDCGVPLFNFGNVSLADPLNTFYGASASVSCDAGFETNTSTILCLASGYWENALCTAKDCGLVPLFNFGNVSLADPLNTFYGASASVSCDAGFETNTSTILCLASGYWENASCTAKDCGVVPSITFGNVSLTDPLNTTYGASASVSCDAGFETNTSTILCLAPGYWENAFCTPKDCGQVPTISNGNVIAFNATNSSYGAKANVTCNTGFTTNSSQVTCKEDGTWSISTCEAKDCSLVPVITNGIIQALDPTNTTFGALANVTCYMGYNTTIPIIACLGNGSWEVPICKIKDCGSVPTISNGNVQTVNSTNTTYGAIANVTCNTGFTTNMSQITCREDGTWTVATCVAKDCGIVPLILNGQVQASNPANTTYGAVANVTCNTGYNTTMSKITCLENGTWEMPICKIKDCGTVPTISNGNVQAVNSTNTTYGAIANVTCNTGYTTNMSQITCREDGTWTVATCVVKDCGIVPLIPNGQVQALNPANTTYGALANVTCITGYNTTTSQITCLGNGTWEMPICKIKDCGAVPIISNGNVQAVNSTNTTYGSIANVTCNTGFTTNISQIICREDGTWTVPTCVAKDCGIVPLIPNGQVQALNPANTTYGAVANVTCNTGYNTTMSKITCLGNGTWETPMCKIKDCGLVPVILNGNVQPVDPANTTYGALANVTCIQGHNTSMHKIKCLDNGTWEIPVCEVKNCGSVPTISNGNIQAADPANTTYRALANVTCNIGYNTTMSQITCLGNGTWEMPTCKIKDCGLVPTISNGTVQAEDPANTTYLALANVTCNTGYNTTLPQITCLGNGTWEIPTCRIKDCGPVPTISNGNVLAENPTNTTYRALANVTCNIGYNTTMSQITCLGNGTWEMPTCKIKECGSVPSISHGNVTLKIPLNTTYRAEATVSCDIGYNATQSVILCTEHGTWDNTTCQIKVCESLPPISHGNLTLKNPLNTTYGAEATVSCDPGYNATLPTLICRANATWDVPFCIIKDCGNPPTVTHGNVTLKTLLNTTYGAEATVSCDLGYNTTLPSIVCTENGSWQKSTCIIKDCGSVLPILHGNVTLKNPLNTTYGAEAIVSCAPGYNTSFSTVICRANATWDVPTCKIKDCGILPSITHGNVTLKIAQNTTYGAEATVSCDPGYNTTLPTILCAENATWQIPTCKIKDCGSVPPLSHGNVTLKNPLNTTYGAEATVSCDPGYNTTLSTITCRANATWDVPICKVKDCGPVPSVLNGNVQAVNSTYTTYGALANVTCNIGYNTTTSQITCTENGTWSTPTCAAKDCGSFPTIAKGNVQAIDPKNTTYGARGNVTCNTGYNTTTPLVLCTENGTWENATCEIKDCSTPPIITHGRVELQNVSETIYGSLANVICDAGFNTSMVVIKCQASGSWEKPVCIILDCLGVPNITNGQVVLIDTQNTTVGAVARVDCDPGYNTSTPEISCTDSGVWGTPKCVVKDCGNVPTISHGNVTLKNPLNTTYGAAATVSCDLGYNTTLTTIVCSDNGDWENSTCKIKDCGSLPPILHGNVTFKNPLNTTFGAEATVSCDIGYNTTLSTITCRANATWDVTTCKIKDCGSVPSISHGNVTLKIPSNTTYGEEATVSCDVGYNTSIPTVTCRANATWDVPTCKVKDCGNVPVITHGNVTLKIPQNTTYGAEASVSCDPGYNTTQAAIVCTENATWQMSTCKIKDCGFVPSITHGNVTLKIPQNTTYGAEATVSCDLGYNTTLSTVTCRANATWDVPTCKVKDCGVVPTVTHGNVTLKNPQNTTYGAEATVSCDLGYNTTLPTIVCAENATWQIPTCKIKDCGSVPPILHGNVTLRIPSNTTYGAEAAVTCDLGYNTSMLTILCRANATWDVPTCKVKDCGNVPPITHGNVTLKNPQNSTYGAEASVSCDLGYNTTLPSIVCAENATWQIPTCKIKDCGSVPPISHGNVTLKNPLNTTYGAEATVSCDLGYNTSLSTVICRANASWDASSCKIKDCGSVPTILHGNVTLKNQLNTTFGAEATVSCDPGYNSTFSTLICRANATWDVPTCKVKDCGNVPTITHGNATLKIPQNTTYRAEATVSCDLGYNTTLPTIMCTENGTWQISTCKIKDCGSVPSTSRGNVTLKNALNTTFGAEATVSCDLGYNASLPTVICTSNGTWQSPACKIIDCGPVIPVTYGNVALNIPQNTTYGAEATVTCDQGYNTTLPSIVCTANATWQVTTCIAIDCKAVPVIDNGNVTPQNVQNTTFGAKANVTCNIGYNTTKPVILCTAAGTWDIPSCKISDCGNITTTPVNGAIEPLQTTTYRSIARYSCIDGYAIVGNATRECLANGSWSSVTPACKIKDCGQLGTVDNGKVNAASGTTYGATVTIICNEGFILIGVSPLTCLNSGQWSGLKPTCLKDKPKTCLTNTDNRGTIWTETPVDTVANQTCASGFTGNITRKCASDGVWQLPQYNCVRDSVQAVDKKVESLTSNASSADVSAALKDIATVTNQSQSAPADQKLTEKEVSVLSSSLEKVANVLSTSSGVLNNDITNSFIESASNLIDDSNKDSWKSLASADDNGAEKVLTAVDSMGEALSKSLQNSTANSTIIVKKNLALEVKKFSNTGVLFPDEQTNEAERDDTKWIRESQSQIQLNASALTGGVQYVTTAVMYRDMSEILPSKRTASNGTGNLAEEEEKINGPILALSISPNITGKLKSPVTIKFQHQLQNYSTPQCSFWSFQGKSQGFWSSDGCKVESTNDNFTICTCDHLTNFAVLMSPFKQADANSKALRIISIVGISISIACLIATFGVHFALWKYLRSDRTTSLMNLCIALLLSYILFLAGIDRTENSAACAAVAALLQYIYLVVFCVMLVEGILIAITVLYVFKTKSRVKLMLVIAWVLPAVIVGISLGVTKTMGYGNEYFCWLSIDNGLIWSFVGPALVIIVFNIICLLLVIRAIHSTKVMETKKVAEKVKTSLRSLAVLVPVMGVSWVLGIFFVHDSFYFIQYIFAILNSLQGFFIFLFHCLLNDKVKQGLGLKQRRKSSTWLKSTLRSTSKDYKTSKDLRATDRSNVESGDENPSTTYPCAPNNWREKVLDHINTPEETKFSSPFGFNGIGNPTVGFNDALRDSSSNKRSRSASVSEMTPNRIREGNTFFERL